jgi:hypothetical protein
MNGDTILTILFKTSPGGLMNTPNDDFPKTPPFVLRDSIDHAAGKTGAQPNHRPRMNSRPIHPSNKGLMNVAVSLISALSMGIGLLGGGWIGLGVLLNGVDDFGALFAGLFAAGLAYGVGWGIGLFGVRMLGNMILPIAMKAYAWIILIGLAALQIAIISRLFEQGYTTLKFLKYVILFCAALAALIGVHLIIEDHDLVPFSFPILIISLFHLYFIVFHYIFMTNTNGDSFGYGYVIGDALFFLLTSVLGALMLAHLGLLSNVRAAIDRFFKEKATQFVPPS